MSILDELSLVSVIWIMAAGVLIFILLFILAKRKIMRFTLKSSRGPYVSIGLDAPKALRREINQRLDRVSYIKYEPMLLNAVMEQAAASGENHYYFRMKAMDDFSRFDEVLKEEDVTARRHPCQTVRNYLLTVYPTYLSTAPSDLISQFCDLYEHARHKPEVFGESHYNKYQGLLNEMISSLLDGIEVHKHKATEELTSIPKMDMEVTFKPNSRGSGKTKTSIPYNHMGSMEKYPSSGYKSQSRYRTRANSSEQAGLLESNQSSPRSSLEALHTNRDSEEKIEMVTVNPMPIS